MTHQNITRQRYAIAKGQYRISQDGKVRYWKCPECGAEMSTERRAAKHCAPLPGEK